MEGRTDGRTINIAGRGLEGGILLTHPTYVLTHPTQFTKHFGYHPYQVMVAPEEGSYHSERTTHARWSPIQVLTYLFPA